DGTSNVIFVAERIEKRDDGGNCWGANALGIRYRTNQDETNNHDRHGQSNVLAMGRPGINAYSSCRRGISSRHEGGVQVTLGDGSVRFISENINHNQNATVNSLMEYLIAIDDGNVVGEF
ncbi:MAG: DUF1559 domain-containing protein, partial [Planctomycetaceae bacterium]|nr:DUF1559 domain-containing protein [Planctomycetaceae bacterium]